MQKTLPCLGGSERISDAGSRFLDWRLCPSRCVGYRTVRVRVRANGQMFFGVHTRLTPTPQLLDIFITYRSALSTNQHCQEQVSICLEKEMPSLAEPPISCINHCPDDRFEPSLSVPKLSFRTKRGTSAYRSCVAYDGFGGQAVNGGHRTGWTCGRHLCPLRTA